MFSAINCGLRLPSANNGVQSADMRLISHEILGNARACFMLKHDPCSTSPCSLITALLSNPHKPPLDRSDAPMQSFNVARRCKLSFAPQIPSTFVIAIRHEKALDPPPKSRVTIHPRSSPSLLANRPAIRGRLQANFITGRCGEDVCLQVFGPGCNQEPHRGTGTRSGDHCDRAGFLIRGMRRSGPMTGFLVGLIALMWLLGWGCWSFHG